MSDVIPIEIEHQGRRYRLVDEPYDWTPILDRVSKPFKYTYPHDTTTPLPDLPTVTWISPQTTCMN